MRFHAGKLEWRTVSDEGRRSRRRELEVDGGFRAVDAFHAGELGSGALFLALSFDMDALVELVHTRGTESLKVLAPERSEDLGEVIVVGGRAYRPMCDGSGGWESAQSRRKGQ